MEILILLAVPTALIWLLVLWNQHARTSANLVPIFAVTVVLVGSVFGYSFFHLSGGPIPITLDRLMLGGVVGIFGILCLRGSESLGPFNRGDIIVVGVMAVISASTITHDWRFLRNMPASRLLFFNLLPVALYVVVRSCKMNIADLKWFSIVLGLLGLYLAITAVFETRGLTGLVFPRYIMDPAESEFLGRGRGPFLNPVSNGIFQCIGLCAIWMWWPQVGKRWKVIIIGASFVMAAGVFSTLTRSVWVGLIATGGLFVWGPASRQMKGLLVMLATVVLIAALPLVGEKLTSFKRDKEVSQADMEQSAQLRPLFVIVAMNMVKDRPLLGCGFGQYAREKYPYLQDPYSGRPLSATKTFMQHNVFLAYVTETGLVGLLMLCAMLLQMALISLSIWRDEHLELWPRMFGLMMLVGLANYCINGMFHDVSIIPMNHVLMFFLFGVVNNLYSNKSAFYKPGVYSTLPAESVPAIIRPRALLAEAASMGPRKKVDKVEAISQSS